MLAVIYSIRVIKYVHTDNKNFVSLLLFRELQGKEFFEFSKGFYHLEPGEVWKQTQVRLFLKNNDLKSYKRIFKENTFFPKHVYQICINGN